MALVLLEGIYRKWVEIPNVKSEKRAMEKALSMSTEEIFGDEMIHPLDIEDLQVVEVDLKC